jgi:hypothetical protein
MTDKVFVIRNQHEQYLDKKEGWQSGKDSAALYSTAHHDEALNTLLEINSKDIELRGSIIEVAKDEKKRPVVEVSEQALAIDQEKQAQEKAALFAIKREEQQSQNDQSDDQADKETAA